MTRPILPSDMPSTVSPETPGVIAPLLEWRSRWGVMSSDCRPQGRVARGIAPSGSHGTGRDSLPSLGSCRLDHQRMGDPLPVRKCAGSGAVSRCQAARALRMAWNRLSFFRIHRISTSQPCDPAAFRRLSPPRPRPSKMSRPSCRCASRRHSPKRSRQPGLAALILSIVCPEIGK